MRRPGNEKASIDYRKRSLARSVDGGTRRRLSTARGPAPTMANAFATEAFRRENSMSDRSHDSLRRRLIVATAAAACLPFAVRAAARQPPAAQAAAPPPGPLLATVYTGQVAPALCLVSEKYDGVRALWDGRVAAPSQRPRGRGARRLPRRASARAARRRALARPGSVRCALGDRSHHARPSAADWARPLHGVRAARRRRQLRRAGDAPGRGGEGVAQRPAVAAPQERIADRAALMRRAGTVVAPAAKA